MPTSLHVHLSTVLSSLLLVHIIRVLFVGGVLERAAHLLMHSLVVSIPSSSELIMLAILITEVGIVSEVLGLLVVSVRVLLSEGTLLLLLVVGLLSGLFLTDCVLFSLVSLYCTFSGSLTRL